ncbi:MAG: RNA polymerase Rpb4 family protein [Methanoregula sp.]|jgi:DNA-directed RNA polymerase subunit F
MKVKGIISEEKVTLSEMRGVLLAVESERIAAEKEMSYEFRRCVEHANQLTKTPPEKLQALVAELLKLEKMKPEIAYRITNIMPKTRDEVRAIYAKERFTLSPEEVDTIVELVMTHF